MKEFNEEYTDFQRNDYEKSPFEKQEDFISPFNSDRKDITNEINNKYTNYNNKSLEYNNSNDKFLSFIDNNNTNFLYDNYNYNLLNQKNNNAQCFRYNLTDEQKKDLQARDNSIINKLLDFFLNW